MLLGPVDVSVPLGTVCAGVRFRQGQRPRQSPVKACRTIRADSVHIVIPIRPSSSCHARGLPSPHAFVAATLGGLGWALHPLALVDAHLASGGMVELVPGSPLDVPLYWQQARIASRVMDPLSRAVTP